MLDITDLTRKFGGTTALNEVSFSVEAGEMVGVIGRSGAGKSTLLRCINRLESITTGAIEFQGRNIAGLRGQKLREWRRYCAMVFQQFNLVDRLDVLTNVLIGRLSYHNPIGSSLKWFSREERALAVLALDRVELSDVALQRADTLSGGQQQRVAIARALVQEPGILLADEPIASLDPRSATQVMELLRDINRRDEITVICNLHTLDTARTYCDRIVGMRAGKVVFDGASADLNSRTTQDIYGATGDGRMFEESVTSTSLPAMQSSEAVNPTI